MEINQCDGCRAGIPKDAKGYHRMGGPRGDIYGDLMTCQAHRYRWERTNTPEELAILNAQAEEWVKWWLSNQLKLAILARTLQ